MRNKELRRIWRQKYYQANKAKHRKWAQAWRSKNRERHREMNRNWARENTGKIQANKKLRDLQKERATPPWSEHKKIAQIYANRPPGHHVDHIIPLRGKNVSGLHVLANLQYLPADENIRKGNKFEAA